MRALFALAGRIDGRANTRPNAQGALEQILGGIDPAAGRPTMRFSSACGEISLFRLDKARIGSGPFPIGAAFPVFPCVLNCWCQKRTRKKNIKL